MKRLLRFLPVAVSILTCFSCVNNTEQPKDPFDVLSSDKTPTAFTLEGQQDLAIIMDDPEDDAAGTISVVIEVREVDLESLTVEDIRLPRGTVATIARGDEIDLSSGTATFNVTAEDGSTRVYTIEYAEPGRSAAKSALGFALEGQIGDAVITDDPDDDTKGTITVVLDVFGGDVQDVQVTALEVSPLAQASIEVGATLDFDDYEAAFTVTADDASVRTYTVIYTEPERSSEKRVLSFAVAGQIGLSSITADPADDTRGTIALTLPNSASGATEMSVTTITVSPLATASVAEGGTLALTGNTASFTVTAEDASVRTYTVTVTYEAPVEIDDIMEGTYIMQPRYALEDWGANAVMVAGGPDDPNAIWLNMYDKNWAWQDGGDSGSNAVQKINSYTIEVVALSEMATTVSGTITLSAPGNNFFNFIWGDGTDFSSKYQLIPNGISSWTRDKSTNEIEFFDGDNNSLGKTFFVLPGTEFTAQSSSLVTVTVGKSGRATASAMPDTSETDPNGYAFHREFSSPGG